MSANLTLGDGTTTVYFRAIDDNGGRGYANVSITITAPTLNVAPVVEMGVSGGQKNFLDRDGEPGEEVNVFVRTDDSDGSIASTRFLIDGEIATARVIGPNNILIVPDGEHKITFEATDNEGASASVSVLVTISPPPPNVAPIALITLGASRVFDSDGEPGEIVTFSSYVEDTDGQITSISWLIGEEVVGSGSSVNLALDDGETSVTLRATDNDGESTSTRNIVTVLAPILNVAPVVEISGGDRNIVDTDGLAGEVVSFIATATDADGSIASTSWLIGGEVVASGETVNLLLAEGPTTVTFRATDDDGDSRNTSVTITVAAPVTSNVDKELKIVISDDINYSIFVEDTDGIAGETVSVAVNVGNVSSTIVSSRWLVGGKEVDIGPSAILSLSDGRTNVTFAARNDQAKTTYYNFIMTVSAPNSNNLVPVASIRWDSRTAILDTDGVAGETVSVTARAADVDGSVAYFTWLIDKIAVLSGTSDNITSDNLTSADLSLSDGSNTVVFRAIDDKGASTSTVVTMTVVAPVIPNVAPVVAIIGGNRSIVDTDGLTGETVSLSATATDADGELASTSWLIGDAEVASGTSARLPLSDGTTTVTFRATDDDGGITSTNTTFTVEAPVETVEEFVTEYNGISAPSFLSEEINTVSVFDINKLKLRSCIRLTLGGEPYSLNGYEQYDMNFNLLSLDDLTFRLVDFRPFNLNGSSNQFGETPDCSGQFELSSNVYKDIIAVPGTTEAGNLKYDYYDLVIDLIDMDSLLFRLRVISIISGPRSVR